MADVISAGTLVGAVLENAGYITQSSFLDAFEGFFQSAGRLLYLLATIGGIVSFAIFGSFRAVRYLIIGPALFWMLIGPRTEVEVVQWRVGGADEPDVNGVSASERTEAITNQEQPVRVARIFYMITSFFSTMVNESVGAIMQFEDHEDLFFTDRAGALEVLVNARMTDARLINLYNNLLFGIEQSPGNPNKCLEFMMNGINASLPELNEQHTDKLVDNADGNITSAEGEILDRAEIVSKAHEAYRASWANSQNLPVTPNKEMIEFLTENKNDPALGSLHEKIVVNQEAATCADLWNTIRRGIRFEANRLADDVAETYREKWSEAQNDPSALDALDKQFCEDIAKRMDEDYESSGECDLSAVAYMYMVRNSLEPDRLSKIVQRHKDRMHFLKPSPTQSYQATGVDNPEDYVPVIDDNGELTIVEADNATESAGKAEFTNRNTGQPAYLNYVKLEEVDGQLQNAYGTYLNYEIETIRNELYGYALELPYWQGVIIYLLAVIYPFWALIVIMPGRAANFMQLPLLYFWAKSWDIGFALVTLFEKVMWNLMPHNRPIGGGNLFEDIETMSLPQLMANGLHLDPSYNLHTYYWAISLITLSIPMLTGAAIFKGKKAILSTFSDAAQKTPGETGSRAQAAYGMRQMNEHIQQPRREMGRSALGVTRSHGLGAQGLLGSIASKNRLAAGLSAGALRTASSAMKGGAGQRFQRQASFGGLANNGTTVGGTPAAPAAPRGIKGAFSRGGAFYTIGKDGKRHFTAGAKRAMKVIIERTKYDFALRKTFGSLMGRFGYTDDGQPGRFRDFEAVAASMDGGGGFEINDRHANAINDMLSYFEKVNKGFFDDAVNVLQATGPIGVGGGIAMLYRGFTDDDLSDVQQIIRDKVTAGRFDEYPKKEEQDGVYTSPYYHSKERFRFLNQMVTPEDNETIVETLFLRPPKDNSTAIGEGAFSSVEQEESEYLVNDPYPEASDTDLMSAVNLNLLISDRALHLMGLDPEGASLLAANQVTADVYAKFRDKAFNEMVADNMEPPPEEVTE